MASILGGSTTTSAASTEPSTEATTSTAAPRATTTHPKPAVAHLPTEPQPSVTVITPVERPSGTTTTSEPPRAVPNFVGNDLSTIEQGYWPYVLGTCTSTTTYPGTQYVSYDQGIVTSQSPAAGTPVGIGVTDPTVTLNYEKWATPSNPQPC